MFDSSVNLSIEVHVCHQSGSHDSTHSIFVIIHEKYNFYLYGKRKKGVVVGTHCNEWLYHKK
jgi:hypothetical protein